MPKHVQSIAEYDEEIKQGKVLVDLFASWCGPCRMLAPIVEQVEQEHPEIKFLKVDVDELPQVAARYDVVSIPTLVVLENGQLKQKAVGFMPKPNVEKLIA